MGKNACLICGKEKFSVKAKRLRDSRNHSVLKCKNCGHIQIYPIPTLAEEQFFYDNNKQEKNLGIDFNLTQIRKKSMADTNRRTLFVTKLARKSGKILEIGSGYGLFFESMEKLGYNITGIEISKQRRKISRRITNAKILDINIVKDTLNFPKLDMIILFHVLEHIIEPVTFLKKLKKLLKSNGKIIVEVPNYDDHQLDSNKSYRNFYWQRAHIHYFTPKILRMVLHKAGFTVNIKGIQRYSIENFMNWKLTGKPQLENPTFSLPDEYRWIDSFYKNKIEKLLKSDTIIAIGYKNKN
mgnify:CR=1 FL=1